MRWPLWVTCRHVWGNAGSSFIQRLFSCFSPTLLAFAYTTFVLTMMKTIKIKKNRMKGWRSRATPRLEEPAGLWLKQQLTRAEEKVCAIYITVASVIVCSHLNLSRRAKHARMLWWTASLGPWWLHPVAWCTSGAGRVCSGPGFALLLSWWVFTHEPKYKNSANNMTAIILHRLAVRLWGLHLLCCQWRGWGGGFWFKNGRCRSNISIIGVLASFTASDSVSRG